MSKFKLSSSIKIFEAVSILHQVKRSCEAWVLLIFEKHFNFQISNPIHTDLNFLFSRGDILHHPNSNSWQLEKGYASRQGWLKTRGVLYAFKTVFKTYVFFTFMLYY